MRAPLGLSLFASAVAGSAAVHALVLAAFSGVRVGPANAPREFAEMAVVFDAPAAHERDPVEFDIGQPMAEGYGTHDVEGRRMQFAREAPQDQPSLSLDPVGLSLRVEIPSSPGELPHVPLVDDAALSPALAAEALPPLVVAPFVPRDLAAPARGDSVVRTPAIDPAPEVETGDAALAPATEPVTNAMTPAAPAAPVTPGPRALTNPGTGADPAPQSDSESDAFSVLGSAQFRAGKVTVRSGRQVKTRRPKVGLAGMVDLAQGTGAEVILDVSVDATGKVTNVDVAESSGSNEIDQPCRVAMYDWWFGPKKDAAGRAVPDRFRFTISFR